MIKRSGRYGALLLALILGLAGFVVEAINRTPTDWGVPAAAACWAISFASVGFVIAGRKPDNPIGWLLLGAGIFSGVNAVFTFRSSDPALDELAAATVNFSWVPAVAGVATALALLPDGRLPSPRWRPVVIALWIVVPLWGVVQYGGDALLSPNVVQLALQLLLLAVLAAVFVRFRRARGLERQQLKWIAYSGAIVAVIILVAEIVVRLFAPELYLAATMPVSLAIIAVPVTIGLAILRYRLYDIDRLISRTVAYGLITVVLIGTYAAVIFVLGRLLPDQSDLSVAASTLAVAALFNPLRRRMQTLVDRRFNRARYDAARVIDSFAGRIRSERGLQAPTDHLLDVARQTMEPLSVSLWLRNRRPG